MNSNNNIYKFFFRMLLIFVTLDFLMMVLASGLMSNTFTNKFGDKIIFEMFYGLIVLIILLLFNNSYVFTKRKEKTITGILLAFPVVVFSIISLINSIGYIDKFSTNTFINILIYSIFVGITEEFLFRGWIQNEFIERFSNNKETIIKSIIFSSLIFGFVHVINILNNQSFLETLFQIANACSLGFLLGCIYYRTKNIWSLVFLHAFYDFALILSEMNVIKDCTYTMPNFSTSIVNSITNILMIIIWLTTAIIIINKTNFPDERVSKKRNKNNKYLVVTIILSFLLMFVPFERIIPGYEKNIICYTFKTTTPLELYTAHIPSYETYKISLTREDPTYVVNDKGEVSLSKTYNNYELYFTEEDGELYLVNKNTSQKYNLGYTDVTNIEILKNNDVYLIVIVSDYNDGTIYYSNYITDYNLSNDKNYLEDVSYSFIEYAVPKIDKLGYITFEYNLEKKIPYLLSEDGKEFIIKNGELFLIE